MRLNQAATYMYSAVIVHVIGTQQSIIVIHFLQEFVTNTEQLQIHGGRRYAHKHLHLSLVKKTMLSNINEMCRQ